MGSPGHGGAGVGLRVGDPVDEASHGTRLLPVGGREAMHSSGLPDVVDLPGGNPRALLALLALRAPDAVTNDEIVAIGPVP